MPFEDLTEMVDIDPVRQDAVRRPASGYPVLIMKAAGAAKAASTPDEKQDTGAPEQLSTSTQDAQQGTSTQTPAAPAADSGGEFTKDSVAKMIADAKEEVSKDAEKRIEALAAEVAKMRAAPIPGGPMLTAPAAARQEPTTDGPLAKAAYHDRQAGLTNDRELIRYHQDRADELRAKAQR